MGMIIIVENDDSAFGYHARISRDIGSDSLVRMVTVNVKHVDRFVPFVDS